MLQSVESCTVVVGCAPLAISHFLGYHPIHVGEDMPIVRRHGVAINIMGSSDKSCDFVIMQIEKS